MKEKRYIIGLDEGTTSARAVVYDIKKNKIVAISGQSFRQYYPNEGWVEQDAEEVFFALEYSLRKALNESKINLDQVVSMGLTNQRETVVAWDKQTGVPIYNAIVWQCRRTADVINKLTQEQRDYIKQVTGLVADPYFSASKMQWILKNVPEAKKLEKEGRLCLGTIDSYIAFKLTGNFVTDTSNASRTMLFNIHTLDWDDNLLKMWGIKRESLAKVVSSSEVVGNVAEFNNIELASIIGDQQASLVGHGCLSKGQTKVTYGTGAFILTNAGNKITTESDKLLTTIAYTVKGKTVYALEGSVFSACSAINWLKFNMKMFERVEHTEKMALSEKDNGGVYFVPAFTGLGAPYWNPQARACYVGINFATNKNHMVRAVLESLAYGTVSITREMEKCGVKIKQLRADGGGSKNNFVLQFLSDISNIDVFRSESSECTVLGAIYLAGVASDVIKFEDIAKLSQVTDKFSSNMDKKKRELLLNGWEKAVQRSNWV